MKQRNIKPEKD
ncbi:hypothetical protein SEUBUCD646_0M03320 [Saccharomyces eubayanus]|nr:CMC4-like protein [Saccharomyces eubayanus]KOG97524.1 CMC4-like protein [Saccharomyces eubayanus]CAI1646271.1 hypothetical protein SEUBUCD650_0M03260 [Saccharomyces eubayanus]CAI1675587.1 hypothetical protein SEUBUCD646_0M03320 [Saccharomyces eubayanus]